MSRVEPIKISIGKDLFVDPEFIYEAKVIKSGNGAVIKSFKRFINKNVIIIVEDEMKKKNKIDEYDVKRSAKEIVRDGYETEYKKIPNK